MNAYEKENLVKRAPKEQLIAVMQGQSDAFPQWMALAELNMRREMGVATDGLKAQQQLAQGKQTVKDRKLAELLPEEQGIGQLPAQNMEALAAAEGGIMGYADGGEVAHFDGGGPTYGEALSDFLRRQFMPGEYLTDEEKERVRKAYKNPLNVTEGKSFLDTPINRPPLNAPKSSSGLPGANAFGATGGAEISTANATANAAANALKDAPTKLKKDAIDLTQPKVPVADPTKQQSENVEDQIGKLDKWTTYLDKKYGDLMNPIKEQLQRDRDEYANMKRENVGISLLGAAGALLKPGRTTASAIGEGLSTLGEYGMRFQPQMLAARQGISAGEIGLANAQAQATRGNFATAAQLQNQEENRALKERELASQEQYQRDVGSYYRARAADTGAGGGMNQKLYAQTYNNANKAWEKFVAGKGGSLYKPKPGEQEAFIKNYMQQSLPSLNLAGASSGYTGGPNIIRGGAPNPDDIMG